MTSTYSAAIRDESTVDDGVFAALASERRRIALRRLQTADDPVTLADLARDVAARQCDTDPSDVSEEVVEQVYVSLHHRHLPKLVYLGYLRYDEDRTSVVLTDEADALEPLLEWAAHRTE